jgi:hypothetical protein
MAYRKLASRSAWPALSYTAGKAASSLPLRDMNRRLTYLKMRQAPSDADTAVCALGSDERFADFTRRPSRRLGIRGGHMKFERRVGGDCARAADELVDGFGGPRVELQALDKGVFDAEAAVNAAACSADEDAVVD